MRRSFQSHCYAQMSYVLGSFVAAFGGSMDRRNSPERAPRSSLAAIVVRVVCSRDRRECSVGPLDLRGGSAGEIESTLAPATRVFPLSPVPPRQFLDFLPHRGNLCGPEAVVPHLSPTTLTTNEQRLVICT